MSDNSRALYQTAGIRGDMKTFTSFRSLIRVTSSEPIVRWIFDISWQLLIDKFCDCPTILEAVSLINIDGGMVQRAVLDSLVGSGSGKVFPNASLRFCFWHAIKKPFREEILTHHPKQHHTKLKEVQRALKFYFLSCETEKEQFSTEIHLATLIKREYWPDDKAVQTAVIDSMLNPSRYGTFAARR